MYTRVGDSSDFGQLNSPSTLCRRRLKFITIYTLKEKMSKSEIVLASCELLAVMLSDELKTLEKKKLKNLNRNMAAKKTLVFVTGNAKKLKEVQELVGETFPFKITNKKIDLLELQGEPDDITKAKCLEASKVVKGPVIVEDTCLCFDALGGLPGAYIKWFLDSIGTEGLHNLLAKYEDKSAVALCTFGFHSGNPDDEVLLFHGRVPGDIVFPRGENNFGWDSCFQPKGYSKSFAEMNSEEKHEISHRRRAIDALRKHFEEDIEREETTPGKRKAEDSSHVKSSEKNGDIAEKKRKLTH